MRFTEEQIDWLSNKKKTSFIKWNREEVLKLQEIIQVIKPKQKICVTCGNVISFYRDIAVNQIEQDLGYKLELWKS